MRIGHFSLIQYSRDPAREEWLNLGVVVATSTEVVVKLEPRCLDRAHLPEGARVVADRSLVGLVARLGRVQPSGDASALVELRGREGGHVNISAPRPTEVVTAEATATDILKTLVWTGRIPKLSRKKRTDRLDLTQLLMPGPGARRSPSYRADTDSEETRTMELARRLTPPARPSR